MDIVICGTCGKNLGEHRPFFAEEHLEEYPGHDNFMILDEKRLTTLQRV
jgi:hypothetical protein